MNCSVSEHTMSSYNEHIFPFNNSSYYDFSNVLNGNSNYEFPMRVIDYLCYKSYTFHNDDHDFIVNEPICNNYFFIHFYNQLYLNLILKCCRIIFLVFLYTLLVLLTSFSSRLIFHLISLVFCETRLNHGISHLFL